MSAKSQKRRLARKFPRKPKDMSLGLDWSEGANEDPIASLHRQLQYACLPIIPLIARDP